MDVKEEWLRPFINHLVHDLQEISGSNHGLFTILRAFGLHRYFTVEFHDRDVPISGLENSLILTESMLRRSSIAFVSQQIQPSMEAQFTLLTTIHVETQAVFPVIDLRHKLLLYVVKWRRTTFS
jgi:hypothetical protein